MIQRTAILAWAATAAFAVTVPVRPSAIADLSESFETVAKTVGPAVVQVKVSGYGVAPSRESGNVVALTRESGVGSGVVVSADGYIVTNAHVVRSGQKIEVLFRDDAEGTTDPWPAKLVGTDRDTDLAVIKVDRKGLPHLELADSGTVRQGQVVLAFGSPLGLANTMTMGVVSATARQFSEQDFMQFIQTDTPINPGNSGGPLVNATGEVVGINTMILSQSGGSEGVGFAIPANLVRSVYEQIRETGRVRRGRVGLSTQNVNPLLAEGLGLGVKSGVLLSDIDPSGPAAAAGLKIGDVVVSLDDQPVRESRQVGLRIFRARKGEQIKVGYWRDGKLNEAAVEAGERPEPADQLAAIANPKQHLVPQLGLLGITIDKDNAALLDGLREPWGVAVAALTRDATAWTDQLQPGDVIHRVNGLTAASLEFLRDQLKSAQPGTAMVLQVERESRMRYVAFRAE